MLYRALELSRQWVSENRLVQSFLHAKRGSLLSESSSRDDRSSTLHYYPLQYQHQHFNRLKGKVISSHSYRINRDSHGKNTMKSTRAAKKKAAASRFHEDDDGSVEFVGVRGVFEDDSFPNTRHRMQQKLLPWLDRVKKESPCRNYLDGETNCPICRLRGYFRDGVCNMVSCHMTIRHKNDKEAHFCGHCLKVSPDGIARCSCSRKWDRQAREEELNKPIDSDDDDDDDGTSSHFTSDQSGTGSDFNSADPSYFRHQSPKNMP